MDISRLPAHWRGMIKFVDVAKGETLNKCADQLEQAWHEYAHDGAWETDGSCRHCDNERKEET